MTCEQCEQILLDTIGSRDNRCWTADASLLNLARSHARNCSACAAKMTEIEQLNDGLDGLRASMMFMEASATAQTKLLAAFRRETRGQAWLGRWALPRRLAWGSAAVVLLLVAVGIMIYLGLRPDSPTAIKTQGAHEKYLAQNRSSALSTSTTASAAVDKRLPGVGLFAPSPGRETVKVATPRHKRVRPSSHRVVGDELSLNGGSTVVRVSLPLSSLVAMGVPVYPERSDRRVIADVVVDPFGSVIAVNFVDAKPSAD